MTPNPLLELSPKFIRFGDAIRPLLANMILGACAPQSLLASYKSRLMLMSGTHFDLNPIRKIIEVKKPKCSSDNRLILIL